ncbi:MAG: FkbM family methyltransferase [Acidimicrobiales bacterium]
MAMAGYVAELVPERVFARTIALVHHRFEPILGQLPSLVGVDQTVLDVGTWYGPWTHKAARVARSVVTVEANPVLAAFVARTTPRNVRVIPKAASDRAGRATLWLPPGRRGTEGRASLSPLDAGTAVEVETIRLDSLDVDDVGLIKIDVEGHERQALLGAAGLVEKWRPNLVVEIEDSLAPAVGTLRLLAEWGYVGWFFRRRRWHSLADLDLVAHQQAMAHHVQVGYLEAVLRKSGDRYVNTVLFQPPGATPPR